MQSNLSRPDLSTAKTRVLFVGYYAVKFGLDPELVAAVCEQESGWDPWAYRYEPAFFDRYIRPMNLTLTNATEAVMRSTSWGLMQIMGQTAREFGFAGLALSQLCDPDVGVEYGCKKLQKCFDIHGRDQELSLLAYNGGSNHDYPRQVLARVDHYKF